MSPYNKHRNKFLWTIVIIVLAVGAWQLSSLFQGIIFGIEATVQARPPETTQTNTNWTGSVASYDGAGSVTGGTGNTGTGSGTAGTGLVLGTTQPENTATGSEPEQTGDPGTGDQGTKPRFGGGGGGGGGGGSSTVTVNTDNTDYLSINPTGINFGYVFPGESNIKSELTVSLKNPASGPDQVTYKIYISIAGGLDLTIQKDVAESDADTMASASLDKQTDTSDRWIVTLNNVPDTLGEYLVEITVEVTGTGTPP